MRDKFPALMRFLQEQQTITDYESSEIRYGGNEGYKGRVYLIDRDQSYWQIVGSGNCVKSQIVDGITIHFYMKIKHL